ncbi:hypothetical protein [Stenotrophomonas maltophilia]|uniref:hypothetical protein n=1 Tax=Stenotrophomonas maltophilia TaxID=40324 RepID=UPI0039C2259C
MDSQAQGQQSFRPCLDGIAMRRYALCIFIALSMPLCVAAASEPTPEKAFDLLIKAMYENDPSAVQALGGPQTDADTDMFTLPDLLATYLQSLKRYNGSAAGDDSAHQAWASDVVAGSRCRADRSAIWHDVIAGTQVADVHFTCRVGDVERLRSLSDAALFGGTDQGQERLWKSYMAILRDGPYRTISGSTRLVSSAPDHGWQSEQDGYRGERLRYGRIERDVGQVLIEALVEHPRDQSNETLRTAIMHITGLDECDNLVHHHRRCMARIAPQELAGAHELAQVLSRRHKEISEAELVQQCMALRPRVEALWNRDCE